MASISSITHSMNNIILKDEEEGGLALEDNGGHDQSNQSPGFIAKLCLVGRFIAEGPLDFLAMQQTLAALWKPGKGVFIRELDANLFLFQFYHDIDIKRVLDGSPWTFNRKALIISRMQNGENPRCVKLNALDLWDQIYDLQPGFMLDRVFKEIGNYIATYVESCQKNFHGVWKEYVGVRVTIDLSKPLKRRMKVRKIGDEWFWINFKYENVPTFCFICGLLGHSDRYCGRLFDTPKIEIIKPYGIWKKAPFRR